MIFLDLILFWYVEAGKTFFRIWQHTIAVLEEDLAVTLMWKLLFTPLFHDSSFPGRILSVIFRTFRILIGLLAFLLATVFITLLALVWFFAPLMTFYPGIWYIFLGVIFLGLTLFLERITFYPKKTVKEVQNDLEVWQATKVRREDVTWEKLLKTSELKDFLALLEITPETFSKFNLPVTTPLLDKVWKMAKDNGAQYITPAYFWVGMLSEIPNVENGLLRINLHYQDFEGTLKFFEHKRNAHRSIYIWDEDFGVKHLKGVNRGWLSAPTPNLDSVSDDLTRLAATTEIPDFVGREEALKQVIDILSNEKGKNVLLVGPAGSGKTALVKSLAKMIVTGNAPKALATKRIVSLELSKLLSGVKTEGDLAEKIKGVFEEVRFIQDIVIYVDEIQNLGIGEAGSFYNLYSLILPHLESDEFQFLSSTEEDSYAKILEKNSALSRLFSKVEIPPATPPEATAIVSEEAIKLERRKGIEVTYLAISLIVSLSKKLIHDRVLPDSAISVLNDCLSIVGGLAPGLRLVSTQVVKQALGRRVNVPLNAVGTDQRDLLLNLENIIHQKLIDQEEAVRAVANTLRRGAASLREESRPIGSFLFVGPTGVGKTEMAKTLAEVYFKDKGAFIRFDMSEYQTPESVNRLLGTETDPGELTEAIKRKPYCLLLLDEFEKADMRILTLFLQVLDDGRLTDASGKTVDFTNTIIIATSNAASVTIAQALEHGQSVESLKQTVNDELMKDFKPELINRFDEVVIFKPLSNQDLSKVVIIKLRALKESLKNQGYLIDFTPDLVAELAKRGFDPVLGARPLRRLIQDTLESRLSVLILENKLPKGQIIRGGLELLN